MRILRALFAAVTISTASMGTVGTAQAQVTIPADIIAACSSAEAEEALCLSLIAAYIESLGLTGAELDAALLEFATALASLPGVSKAVDAILASALETIAAAATPGSAAAATIADLAVAIRDREITNTISDVDLN